MSAITKILTSAAVVGALITGLFGWTNNRTNNSLNYITDERKRWRDKIREISEAIETCKFHGEDKENINVYLLQLENNINPYGRFQPSDYEHDGHIWEVIGKIERAENEEEFKKYQKELLSYLQLLLKEDWERIHQQMEVFVYLLRHLLLWTVAVAEEARALAQGLPVYLGSRAHDAGRVPLQLD